MVGDVAGATEPSQRIAHRVARTRVSMDQTLVELRYERNILLNMYYAAWISRVGPAKTYGHCEEKDVRNRHRTLDACFVQSLQPIYSIDCEDTASTFVH